MFLLLSPLVKPAPSCRLLSRPWQLTACAQRIIALHRERQRIFGSRKGLINLSDSQIAGRERQGLEVGIALPCRNADVLQAIRQRLMRPARMESGGGSSVASCFSTPD
jgi:hypothetical protein